MKKLYQQGPSYTDIGNIQTNTAAQSYKWDRSILLMTFMSWEVNYVTVQCCSVQDLGPMLFITLTFSTERHTRFPPKTSGHRNEERRWQNQNRNQSKWSERKISARTDAFAIKEWFSTKFSYEHTHQHTHARTGTHAHANTLGRARARARTHTHTHTHWLFMYIPNIVTKHNEMEWAVHWLVLGT